MSKMPPSQRRRHVNLTPQFVEIPGTAGRMVVLPEAQYRLLERLMADGMDPGRPRGWPASFLPSEFRDRVAKGESAVRVIREWRGLSAKQLAALVDITPSMLSQIERSGKTGSTRTFHKIALVLGVPIEQILPRMRD